MHTRHSATPLATAHTSTIPGRFNPGTAADPAFELLYLASSPLVAQFEVQALLGSPYPGAAYVPNPTGAWIVVNVDVNLQSVVDLRLVARRRMLQTSVQELTGDWRGYSLRNPTRLRGGVNGSDVPTQLLGIALEQAPGLEGFICHSARVSTLGNLMIFPHKLAKGSWVRCVNPATGRLERIS